MSDDPNRCKAMVRSPYLLDAYQCQCGPGYGPDGWYCKQHAAERIHERRQEKCNREAGEAAIEVCRMLLENHPDDLDTRILAKAIINKLDKALKENG